MSCRVPSSPSVPLLCLLTLFALPALAADQPADKSNATPQEKLIKSLHWREIGPYRGGRADAVTGIEGDRSTYYFGATGGGVWKTTDAGRTWKNVSDGFFGGSIGDVAVAAWDPNVVYAGTGEVTVRGNVSEGDGMWKSTDAGKTWKHIGLENSRHIVRIRIHPKNPDLVYAAVLGHLFGASADRGVYRSKDGGKTWERILHVNDDAGAFDLAMDPVNPRVLYASLWRIRRTPWGFDSGGPGSSLWKSTDGGDTWTDLSTNPGMPAAPLGVIGVSVSRTRPDNLYAIVEAKEGGLFRSKDGGKTWSKISTDHALRQRAWYYSRVFADPTDVESVYVTNVAFLHSKDGGKSFSPLRTPHGDNHDLWLDPADALRMIECNDGGANVSEDGGLTWSGQDNQPTAQIYRVSTDNAYPYRVLGAQQDNSALRSFHRSFGTSIGPKDWEPTAGGESGYIVADPHDPNVVYGGSYGGLLIRLNHETGEIRDINPWPDNPMGAGAADLKHRFQWNFPLLFSHDGKTLYTGSNVLMKTTDEGQSWQVISPDLTRNDKSKQGPTGGPITKDNTSVEYYDTVFTIAESPLDAKVLWVGSDDGLVHVSRDGGANWTNVTPHGMPEWMQINEVEANPFDAAGAYFAGTLYKLDDERPFLYATADYGKTWRRIDSGIGKNDFTRVVRADPGTRGLLYAGTQHGIMVSFDDGDHWQALQSNLPLVPVTDLTIKDNDLIAATEGRGFWSIDDLAPLRALRSDAKMLDHTVQLFPPEKTYLPPAAGGFGFGRAPGGENPPTGIVLRYWLKEAAGSRPVKLEILGPDGKVIRTFHAKPEAKSAKAADAGKAEEKAKSAAPATSAAATKPAEKAATTPSGGAATPAAAATGEAESGGEEAGESHGIEEGEEGPPGRRGEEAKVGTAQGLNQFVWDGHYEAWKGFPGMVLWTGRPSGPTAAPGHYQVRLTVGDETMTAPFEVANDPRSHATTEDMQAQLQFLIAVRGELDRTSEALRRIRAVRAQLDDLRKRIRAATPVAEGETPKPEAGPYGPLLAKAKDLNTKMTAVEEALYQTHTHSSEDALNFPIRLNDKLNGVASTVDTGDRRPTAQDIAVRDELVVQIDAQLQKLDAVWQHDLPEFNEAAKSAGAGAVILPAAAQP
jgi:photosystem II stability/assembly factor-like uncharacterized protein